MKTVAHILEILFPIRTMLSAFSMLSSILRLFYALFLPSMLKVSRDILLDETIAVSRAEKNIEKKMQNIISML
jgi:hypothetical protein